MGWVKDEGRGAARAPDFALPYNCHGECLCSVGYQSQIDGLRRFAAPPSFS